MSGRAAGAEEVVKKCFDYHENSINDDKRKKVELIFVFPEES